MHPSTHNNTHTPSKANIAALRAEGLPPFGWRPEGSVCDGQGRIHLLHNVQQLKIGVGGRQLQLEDEAVHLFGKADG